MATSSTLRRYRRDYYSQNGEDGIIEEVLKRLGITCGYCVEFGAWDGRHLSNTYHLVDAHDWRGLYIEADPVKYSELLQNEMVLAGRVTPVNAYVSVSGSDTLDEILVRNDVPADFDLLSIDVDGLDLDIWESLTQHRPKIVIVEVDSYVEPDVARVQPDGRPERSFANMLWLGRRKRYTLICHTGNMIFVVDELIEKLGLDDELADPESLFCDRWVREKRNPLIRFRNRLIGFVKNKLAGRRRPI